MLIKAADLGLYAAELNYQNYRPYHRETDTIYTRQSLNSARPNAYTKPLHDTIRVIYLNKITSASDLPSFCGAYKQLNPVFKILTPVPKHAIGRSDFNSNILYPQIPTTEAYKLIQNAVNVDIAHILPENLISYNF